jgi:hypothetical protein
VRAAAGIGLAVPDRHRAVLSSAERSQEPERDAGTVTVTVVGDRCFGEGIEALAAPARRLAEVAGAELLAVRFDGRAPGAAFLGADPWPDVASPDVARAVAALLTGGAPS